MKNKIKEFIPASGNEQIKVQLDYKTIITLYRMSSLEVWLRRYPEAKVIIS